MPSVNVLPVLRSLDARTREKEGTKGRTPITTPGAERPRRSAGVQRMSPPEATSPNLTDAEVLPQKVQPEAAAIPTTTSITDLDKLVAPKSSGQGQVTPTSVASTLLPTEHHSAADEFPSDGTIDLEKPSSKSYSNSSSPRQGNTEAKLSTLNILQGFVATPSTTMLDAVKQESGTSMPHGL